MIAVSEDYIASSSQVTFNPDISSTRQFCSNITIISDDILEDVEEFLIFIDSSDSGVQITQLNASVFIVDNNGENYSAE